MVKGTSVAQIKKGLVYLRLNKRTDADIIEKLSKVDNTQGYNKALIRTEMEEK